MEEFEPCVVCNTLTSRRCTVCNTYYCSTECEHKNKEAHKIYCFPELHQRLKSILNFAHKNIPRCRWTLSRVFNVSGFELTAYSIYDERIYCAICSKPYTDNDDFISNINDDEYIMCSYCRGKKICNISFMESVACSNKQKSIGKTYRKIIT